MLFWHWLSTVLCIDKILFAAVAVVIPIILTGGIHMDGFCDTVDAIASHREMSRKLEIMKDTHVGAFAVIYAAVYIILCFGLYASIFTASSIPIIGIGFIFSRALTVSAVATIKNARGEGMLAAFTDHISRRISWIITILFFLISAVGFFFINLIIGSICIFFCGAWFFIYRRFTLKQFGGITGDTVGFFQQITELLILICALIGVLIERLLYI